MTDATPRPWLLETDQLKNDTNIHRGDPWTPDSVWIASTLGRPDNQPGFPSIANAAANAALIVRAVNSHDALTEALSRCAGQFRACLIASGTDPEYADIAIATYLDLASGEPP